MESRRGHRLGEQGGRRSRKYLQPSGLLSAGCHDELHRHGRRATAQLNLRNLTNAKYFDGADIFFNAPARFGGYAAQPFMAFGTIRMEF